MSNMRNDIRYDIDKCCIQQIFAHTNNISMDDVSICNKTLKNLNLIELMV